MEQIFECSLTNPTVDTSCGRVRGYTYDGVHHFMGIRYGTAKRFQAAEPAYWQGVEDAFVFGDACYTTATGSGRKDYVPLLQGTRPCSESEDCLNLNIWTPSLDFRAKLPVVVWVPGGGFHAGSAGETPATEGFEAAKYGDVVFVSINHRIAILGFLDLSPFDQERYRNSANQGLADMVLALEWIKKNIYKFGGDPNNVTLAGHSGGGCKQWALMQTPAADGLFHKCVMESGVSSNMVFPKKEHNGYNIVHKTLEKLGLTDSDVRELETMDYRKLLAGYMAAYSEESAAYMKDGVYRYVGKTILPNEYFAGYPYDYGLREEARKIPCIIGSALGESGWPRNVVYDKRSWSDEGRMIRISQIYGDDTEEMIRLFNKAYPGKDPLDLVFYESPFRTQVLDWCAMKEKMGAPCWNYLFALESPMFDGFPAHHGSEIPFLLHTVDKMPAAQVPGISGRVQDELFGALVNFARNGDPNHDGLTHWDPWTEEHPATMIFDEETRLAEAHDRELLEKHNSLIPARRFPI